MPENALAGGDVVEIAARDRLGRIDVRTRAEWNYVGLPDLNKPSRGWKYSRNGIQTTSGWDNCFS